MLGGDVPPGLQRGLTIHRMLIDVGLLSASPNTENFGAYGVEVGSARSMPSSPDSPILDLTNWYLHKNWSVRQATLDRIGNVFDIRTSRRIPGVDKTLWFIFEVNVATLNEFRFDINFRLLLSD